MLNNKELVMVCIVILGVAGIGACFGYALCACVNP